MSWQAYEAVLRHSQSVRSDRLVLLALAYHADKDGQNAYPTVRTLMEETKLSERKVRTALSRLEELGEITIFLKAASGQANLYALTLPINTPKVVQKSAPPKEVPESTVVQKSAPPASVGTVAECTTDSRRVHHSGAEECTTVVQKSAPPIERSLTVHKENDDSNQNAHVENFGENDGTPAPPSDIRFSPYIAGIISDYSSELGDSQHITSNVTQALRIYRDAGLDENAFVQLLHDTKRTVRHYQGKQGLGTINRKMAYFFTVLRQALGPNSERGSPPGGMAVYQQ